ncbi:MAG TPA: hypothetical protein VIH22_08100 [Cyclobacteriaceae bacterium]
MAMRATVTVGKKILDELNRVSGQRKTTFAIKEAMEFYLKQKKIEKIKLMKGKLKFDRTAEEIRHSGMGEDR